MVSTTENEISQSSRRNWAIITDASRPWSMKTTTSVAKWRSSHATTLSYEGSAQHLTSFKEGKRFGRAEDQRKGGGIHRRLLLVRPIDSHLRRVQQQDSPPLLRDVSHHLRETKRGKESARLTTQRMTTRRTCLPRWPRRMNERWFNSAYRRHVGYERKTVEGPQGKESRLKALEPVERC
jgi:hypothetical protein